MKASRQPKTTLHALSKASRLLGVTLYALHRGSRLLLLTTHRRRRASQLLTFARAARFTPNPRARRTLAAFRRAVGRLFRRAFRSGEQSGAFFDARFVPPSSREAHFKQLPSPTPESAARHRVCDTFAMRSGYVRTQCDIPFPPDEARAPCGNRALLSRPSFLRPIHNFVARGSAGPTARSHLASPVLSGRPK